MNGMDDSRKWFARFAWGVLAYNIPVILWGAYVRISSSGNGCGAHWPFCNGMVIPQHMGGAMAIEFTHRAMTPVDTIAVIALCVWAFLAFPRKHAVRWYAVLSLVFLFIEALLGAGLVLLPSVANPQSAAHAWYLSAHLTNTMLLLAALTATAWLAMRERASLRWRSVPPRLFGALGIAVIVSVTGALAALADTLSPASSLGAGMAQDFSRASSELVRLRMLHPAIAIVGVAYIVLAASTVRRNGGQLARAATGVIALAVFQVLVGAINISLLAPMEMQLFHLLVADLLWISLVVLALEFTRWVNTDATTPALHEQASYGY